MVGLVWIQGDTEAGTAEAGTPDETISKYEQEKRDVAATCAPPWVLIAHNHPQCTHVDAFHVPSCCAMIPPEGVSRIASEITS